MNRFFTLKFTESKENFEPYLSDKELMRKSEYGIKSKEQPTKKTIDFLLNFSKSLEAKNGFTYQLN
jgi:hypothetical protein